MPDCSSTDEHKGLHSGDRNLVCSGNPELPQIVLRDEVMPFAFHMRHRAGNSVALPGDLHPPPGADTSRLPYPLTPHPGCDALLFLPYGVCINSRSGQLSVTKPFLNHVECDALTDSRHSEPVPQTFRRCMRSIGDASRFDERSHLAPCRHTTPGPETLIESGSTFLLDLTDAVDHIQGIEQLWRDRHLPVNASLTLFQALDDDDLGGQVDAFGRQRQCFRYSASGIAQDAAKGTDLTRRFSRSSQKSLPLLLREVKPFALFINYLHMLQ